MILRIWRGWASTDRPDAYPTHFSEAVLPELRAIAGFVEAELLKRIEENRILFTVVTRWDSMESIRAFAGDDLENAVVHADAAAALVTFDRRVEHHELVVRERTP